ncbi:DUF2142 domain-containing protein [Alicyclobacillus dauci]|uniref:DUF2142 domain-containing protein n=1 Tax=Alicyclobacillus dauci TaxID=1475485 RepID=A0ABY6Z7R1_9BACL|nr:DUF2142 domain-containing protein [Alicyclobacillus dauci]WAH38301.1 DUF2142 domain-containing protein [Alicyclobacillus dauci]
MSAKVILSLRTFILFACAALVWVWVLPIWQGPDETAHFSYVQYMMYHQLPPKVDNVPPGLQPWRSSASHSIIVSRNVTQYNRVLKNPSIHMNISPEMRDSALRHIQRASGLKSNQAGSQNYVGIYPPLYYGLVGKFIHQVDVQNVNHQAYIARLLSALIFGVFGIVVDFMLQRVISDSWRRAPVVYSIPLLFPTLSMLGGVVNNDVLMDTMCLSLFCIILDALYRTVWRYTVCVIYGVVLGVALITKPDTYVLAFITVMVVLIRMWRTVPSKWKVVHFAGVSAVPVLILSGPWFFMVLLYYNSIVPPLTYQGTGSWPRDTHWFTTHLLQSAAYQRSIMVYQTVSGIDFPWWTKPVSSNLFYNVWACLVGGLTLYGGYRLYRTSKSVFVVSLAWVAVVFAFLWFTAYTYLMKTGTHFLQGRYFFMTLPVVIYVLANALKRSAFLLRLIPIFSGLVFATVVNATAYRYYGHGLLDMITGQVVTYDPYTITVVGRMSLIPLALMLIWYAVRSNEARESGQLEGAPSVRGRVKKPH